MYCPGPDHPREDGTLSLPRHKGTPPLVETTVGSGGLPLTHTIPWGGGRGGGRERGGGIEEGEEVVVKKKMHI